jgi:ATPase subunit of ABC transporter with duplicated ATPase domains
VVARKAAKKAKAKKATVKKAAVKKVAAKKAKAKKATARKTRASKARARGAGFVAQQDRPTHVLKRVGGEIVLERVSFMCGCNPTRFRCVSA